MAGLLTSARNVITPRPFQSDIEAACYDAWREGARVVMPVMPTGAGKTVVFSKIVRDLNAPACVIAHRSELVTQASLALAKNGVRHRIIGPRTLGKACAALRSGRASPAPGT